MAFAYEQKIFKKILQISQVRMFISRSCHRTKMSSKLNKMSGNENKIAEGEWGRDAATKPIRRHIVPTSFALHCLKSISVVQ